MIGVMVFAFPLSFFLYLDPNHLWCRALAFDFSVNGMPLWNRYVWFRIIFGVLLGFATIPVFMIPLRVAGEVVRIENAGMSYAFLMALSNVTNTFEGLVGSGLFWLFSRPELTELVGAFSRSPLNIAGVADKRTLILQMFVYISLFFTLLAVPVVVVLRGALERRGIHIDNETAQK